MFNIFLTVFFSTLAFAFHRAFFIGYHISIALFGSSSHFSWPTPAVWGNAKKIVEVT